jgi:hypothetical protein
LKGVDERILATRDCIGGLQGLLDLIRNEKVRS